MDPQQKNRRIHPRKPAKARIKVTCRKGTLDLGANLAVSLLDVSANGVRLMVKAELKTGEEVSVGLEGPTHRRPITRVGKVVWAVPTAEGNFCVGVQLDKFFAYEDLLKLT